MNAPKEPRPTASLEQQLELWERNEVATFLKKQKERQDQFHTAGGIPVKRVYTPLDVNTSDEDIGLPGKYPFTRGPYPTMYRSRLWTMRQIAGFGTGEDTNKRFRYLIEHGQTGLSVDFDMPTLMGYDSDHPMSEGEVGREGVAIDTFADMEHLFDGIDLETISVSMTINPSAWILLAMYVALARKRGAALLGDLVGEGHRLQVKATRLVVEAGSDVQSQVAGMFKPVRAGVARQVQQVGMAIQSGIAGVLAALGIPSKADIDELSHRVGALSRQLKSAK